MKNLGMVYVAVVALLLAGCVSQQKYNEVEQQNQALNQKNATLEEDYKSLNQSMSAEVSANKMQISRQQDAIKILVNDELLFPSGGWEMSAEAKQTNRFVVASAGAQNWAPLKRAWLGRAALTAALGVVLVGGAISGWPWDLQLASPVRASAEGRTISSPPLALANWARENIPADERFGASIADARLLMDPGERLAFAGKHPDIQDMLLELTFSRRNWEMPRSRWSSSVPRVSSG